MDRSFWSGLSRASKLGLGTGVLGILLITFSAAYFLLKVEYQVLFSDLKPQDSAVMVAELDKLKVLYQLEDGGSTILVEKAAVHSTRLKLLSKELPLHGSVGLELFNSSDFGMTEFAQKINYQRAMQGEITRTISSLDEVKDVRVHLAMPEEGLFKRATSKAKAAITIALRSGKVLRREQIAGIQRLVAAAVPGIVAQDVTIVDQHGVALTRVDDVAGDVSTAGLDLKKDMENLLSKKANVVLDQMFGSGKALASVDVVLDMDHIRTTTEDVLSAPNSDVGNMTGVVVKERESSREAPAPLDSNLAIPVGKGSNVQREIEYQVGRRVEQLVSQPGTVKRINIVAVVQAQLDEAQRDQLRKLLAGAVGASIDRGDSVVVQNIFQENALTLPHVNDGAISSFESNKASAAKSSPVQSLNQFVRPQVVVWVLTILGVILASTIIGFLILRSRNSNSVLPMNPAERELVLKKIEAWAKRDANVVVHANE